MRTREILRAARRDGRSAGENAASWVFDGNTSAETYARVLRGLEDGDPETLNVLRVPNLSGEYADDPTPRSLAEDYGIEDRADLDADARADLEAEVADAWETAATDAFFYAVEKTARRALRPLRKERAS